MPRKRGTVAPSRCGRQPAGWLANKREDPEFLRLCAREDLIENFLTRADLEMKQQEISRAELARRMGCSLSNITQLFKRTRNLTAASMVDVAFHLGLGVKLVFDKHLNDPEHLRVKHRG